jgi:hypothetical protein
VTLTVLLPVNDRLVAVDTLNIVPVPVSSKTPDAPNASVRVTAPDALKSPTLSLKAFKFNVPAVKTAPFVETVVRSEPRFAVKPVPVRLKTTSQARVTLLVVMVTSDGGVPPTETNVMSPVPFHTVPATSVKLPLILGVPVLENVTEPALTVRLLAFRAPVSVTVYVPVSWKNTSSSVVGTEAAV